MKKYHVSPSTGNANICKAKLGKCPYEKDFVEHYETKQAAQEAYENTMEYPVSEMSKFLMHYLKGAENLMKSYLKRN